MGIVPLVRSSSRNFFLPRYVILLALVAAIPLAIFIIAGGEATAYFQTSAYVFFALALLLPAASLGLLLTRPFAKRDFFAASPWPDAFRLITAVTLGLGALSLGMLALGTFHLLTPVVIPSLLPLIALSVGYPASHRFFAGFDAGPIRRRARGPEILLLFTSIPIALLVMASTFPAGSLWITEAHGYDVLEYHLQLPREYAALNSTAPLAHNIYSYLPANVEMLYLQLTQLTKLVFGMDTHLFAVFPSQFLHAFMMLLFVAAVILAPLGISSTGRIVASLVALAVPWTIVTGSLAYNEAGMMLSGTLALLFAMQSSGKRRCAEGVLIGALLGLAVGSKMTAGIFFALPVAGILLSRRNPRTLAIAAIVAAAVYSPWAIRTAISSHGNPVFPIATSVLGRDDWPANLAKRFDHGHGALNENPFHALLEQSIFDPQWSPYHVLWFIVPIAIAFTLARRGQSAEKDSPGGAWPLLLVLTLQVLAWMFMTHLQARFLLPILVPLSLLIALAVESFWGRVVIIPLVLVQVILSALALHAEMRESRISPTGESVIGEVFNRRVNFAELVEGNDPPLPPAKILLVGNAAPLYCEGQVVYNTVFNPNPLGDALRRGGPSGAAKWLRDEHFNYVLFDWSEIDRLNATYGYDSAITPENIDALIHAGIKLAPTEQAAPLELLQVAPVR